MWSLCTVWCGHYAWHTSHGVYIEWRAQDQHKQQLLCASSYCKGCSTACPLTAFLPLAHLLLQCSSASMMLETREALAGMTSTCACALTHTCTLETLNSAFVSLLPAKLPLPFCVCPTVFATTSGHDPREHEHRGPRWLVCLSGMACASDLCISCTPPHVAQCLLLRFDRV